MRVLTAAGEAFDMVKGKANSAQDELPLPGIYELARPRQSVSKDGGGHYAWKLGNALPALGEHSLAKHEIFEQYVEIYIRTLTKNHLTEKLKLTIVDGFCGGGRYQRGGDEFDGSPLRMLHAVEKVQASLNEARARGIEIDANFVFIDEKANHIAVLRDQLEKQGFGSRIGKDIVLLKSTFEDAAPDVIAAIRKKGRAHRSLFFLDQYGWSGVKLATVRRIMAELANPEVVLTFMVDAMVNLLCDKNSEIAAMAALDLTREDAKALAAMKGNHGWKRMIQNTLYQHIQRQTGASFYTPFFIHPPESHRDYWLLHLSKHHQAREEMGKVFWSKQNTMEHFGGAGFNALGFDPGVDMRQGMMDYTFDDDARKRSQASLIEEIPRLLHSASMTSAFVSKRDLFAARCNDTPVVSDIVDSQLAELRNSGEIIILGRKPGQAGAKAATVRERTSRFSWDDQIRFVDQRSLFSVFDSKAA